MDFETRLVVFVQEEGVVLICVSSDELFGNKYLLLSSYMTKRSSYCFLLTPPV